MDGKIMTIALQNKQELTRQSKENPEISIIEQVAISGDLSKLNGEQRVAYYNRVCESLGLNPFTKPFEYITLNGKLTLYAKKDCTEQLRKINGISVISLDDKMVDDIYIVTCKVKTKDGRTDESKGAVTIGHLKGEMKANAIMKAETKAKRRATLSISGLGWVDESEIDSIPSAKAIEVDISTGEIKPEPVVSYEQAEELGNMLLKCTSEFQDEFWRLLKENKDITSLQCLPLSCYSKTKLGFEKRIKAAKAYEELELTMEKVNAKES